MTDGFFRFDEVGDWSVLKLEIIEKYGAAYTKAFSSDRGRGLEEYYIDAFSGAGMHIVKKTRAQIEGSPARALKITPKFDRFYFIDLNEDKTAYLQKLCEGRRDVQIHTGDTNDYLRKLLPTIQFEKYNRPCVCWTPTVCISSGR
jgi:three-Cys-motif partner protein